MKKMLSLAVALLLMLGGCACAASYVKPGDAVPDFTVATIDGDELQLSRLLAEKDLVVLNIFTSWCPPCREEFPLMQALYEANADRMALVAVSAETSDTVQTLDDYRKELGLTFPIGRLEGTGIDGFVNIQYYPTTLFINRDGAVAYYQIGSFTFQAELDGLVGCLLDESYDGSTLSFYGVFACDQDNNPVPGVYVSFCSDTACVPRATDENGIIAYYGATGTFHAQPLEAPEGYSLIEDYDMDENQYSDWHLLRVERNE